MEANNLNYIEKNQNKLRAVNYTVMMDTISDQLMGQNVLQSEESFQGSLIQNRIDSLSAEAIYNNDEVNSNITRLGRKIILPSTFHGYPRYMYELYQDRLAIVGEFGVPDYFITFTCSSAWKEIKQIKKIPRMHQIYMRGYFI